MNEQRSRSLRLGCSVWPMYFFSSEIIAVYSGVLLLRSVLLVRVFCDDFTYPV